MAIWPTARLPLLAATLTLGLMGVVLLAEAGAGERATVDEPWWITSGYLTWRLATQVAPLERWDRAPVEYQLGAWGNLNPPVAKYLVGAAVSLARRPGDRMLYAWRWPYGYEENLAAGNLPPEHILTGGRLAIAGVGVLALIVLLLIAREFTGSPWVPLLAPSLLFASEPFRWHSTHIYTDIPQLTLTLLGVWLTLLWVRQRRRWQLPLGLLFLGLACASKLSAGTAVVATTLFVACVPGSPRMRVARATLATALPFTVFVICNPFLWPNPVTRTVWMLEGWSRSVAQQGLDPMHATVKVASLGHAVYLVLMRVFWRPERGIHAKGLEGDLPHLIVVIATVSVLAAAGSLGIAYWRRRGRPLALPRAVVIPLLLVALPVAWLVDPSAWLLVALIGLGVVRLVWRLRGADRCNGVGYFFVLLAATLLATTLWLPFDWARYYLPALALTPILAVLGAAPWSEASLPATSPVDPPSESS
jgi:hypothetical protein